MVMSSLSPRVLSARAASFSPKLFARRALWRAIGCLAALLGLLAIDAPRSRAFAWFFRRFRRRRGQFRLGKLLFRRAHGAASAQSQIAFRPRQPKPQAAQVRRLDRRLRPSDGLRHAPQGRLFDSTCRGFSTPLFPRTVCVRACDGYAFGRAPAYGGYDPAARETACAASCPDAETKLFVLPAGVDDVVQSKEARVGGSYAQLLAQFRNREEKPASCGCHVASNPSGEAKALLSDPTLRQGDMVVTDKGVRFSWAGPRSRIRPATSSRSLRRERFRPPIAARRLRSTKC